MKVLYSFISLFSLITFHAVAQPPGALDLSFGNSGTVYENFGGSARANDMTVLPDDRILIVGVFESDFGQEALIARFLPEGDIDTNFGDGGSVKTDLGGEITGLESVALLPDGRFYVAGKTHLDGRDHMVVARFLPDGNLDADFGAEGYTVLSAEPESSQSASDLATDGSGRITVSGFGQIGQVPLMMLARLNSDGTLDQTFGEGGFVIPPATGGGQLPTSRFTSLALQNDNKILAAGHYGSGLYFTGTVMRFEENGSPDETFGEGGVKNISDNFSSHQIQDVAITAEGNIMVCGNYSDNGGPVSYLLMRLLPDGSPDNSFGNAGYSTPPVAINGSFGRAVYVPHTAGNPLIAVGYTGDSFSAIRVTHDGVLDSDFAMAGIIMTPPPTGNGHAHAAARQSDGKLVVAGTRIFNVAGTATLLRYHMESTLSIDSRLPSADLQAYPNPSRDHVRIVLPEGAQTLTLHNTNGRRVMERGLNGDATFEADVSRLAQGIYHLTVTDRNGQVYRKKIAVL